MTVALSLDAPRQVRASFDRYGDKVEQSLFDDLRILCSELVTNAVQHSGRPEGDPIEVGVSVTSDLIRVEVTDQGEGVEPLRPRSHEPPSGLGFVDHLSDRWSGAIVGSFQVWFEIDVHSVEQIRRRPRQS